IQRVASDTCGFSAGLDFSLIGFSSVMTQQPAFTPVFLLRAVRSIEGLVEFQGRVFERLAGEFRRKLVAVGYELPVHLAFLVRIDGWEHDADIVRIAREKRHAAEMWGVECELHGARAV